MDKQECLERVRQGYAALARRIEGLEDGQLAAIMRADGWPLHQVLTHLAAWYDIASKRLGLIAEGRAAEIRWLDDSELDSWNARFHQRDQSLAPAQARQRWQQAHQRVVAALQALPEQRWAEPGLPAPIERWMAACTYEHDAEHLEELEPLLRD